MKYPEWRMAKYLEEDGQKEEIYFRKQLPNCHSHIAANTVYTRTQNRSLSGFAFDP